MRPVLIWRRFAGKRHPILAREVEVEHLGNLTKVGPSSAGVSRAKKDRGDGRPQLPGGCAVDDAGAYADLNEQDYRAFGQAVAAGRAKAKAKADL